MAGLAIASLFLLMVAAPCLVAMRSSRETGDIEECAPELMEAEMPQELEPEELPRPFVEEFAEKFRQRFKAKLPAVVAERPPVAVSRTRSSGQRVKAPSLRDLAMEAEMEALLAKERAERAHWEALTAAAHAAALRADAAAQAAQAACRAANRAMQAAETEFFYEEEYVLETHPSQDLPREPETPRWRAA